MPRMARYLLTPKGQRGVVQAEPDEEMPDPEKQETQAMQKAEKAAGQGGKAKKPSLSSMIQSSYKPRKPQ